MKQYFKLYNQNIKEYSVLLIVLAIATFVTYVFLKWLFPSFYFKLYPLVPVYFLAMGVSQIAMFHIWKNVSNKQFFTVYMITRFLKILISVVVAFLGFYFMNQNKEVFLAIFVLFYFVYLGFETWLFSKKMKENKPVDE